MARTDRLRQTQIDAHGNSAVAQASHSRTHAFRVGFEKMATGDTHPTDTAAVVRQGKNGAELIQMRWGLKPQAGGEPIINVRAETADVNTHRCLLPATEFFLFTGEEHPKRRWRITLKDDALFFFAGLWRKASLDWPESYAILTIDAAPDLAALADRQMAVIRRKDTTAWLETGAKSLLEPLPKDSYLVDKPAPLRREQEMASK